MKIIDIFNEIKKSEELNSFHIFSGKYFRAQILKFNAGKQLNNFQLKNENLLIIVIEGRLKIRINDKQENVLNRFMQVIIQENENFSINVIENCILEYIWSPGLYKLK